MIIYNREIMKIIKYIACLLLAAGVFAACTKEDDYKKFTEGGEITYPARADSIIVQPGNKRIQLRVVLGSDPSISKVKVYWNNRADSTEMAVTRSTPSDTVNVLISGLSEGVYNFEVYTFNQKNDISVVKNATGSVYGDSFASTLTNRAIREITQAENGNAVISWMAALAGERSIEMTYKDLNGHDKTVFVPGGEMVTEIADYQDKTALSYRSVFVPDSNAYDEYKMDFETVTLPVFERQFPKAGFAELILPTDVLEGGFGWLMPALWNGTYEGNGFATQPGKPLPVWFTFDMGISYKINRFVFWMPSDRIFNLEAVRSFEIWGSNDPAPDGSWDSWTLLRICEVLKPSGAPLGTNTDADVAAAAAGQEFIMPPGVPKTRYIRIKVLSNWGNGAFQALGEFSFYSKER